MGSVTRRQGNPRLQVLVPLLEFDVTRGALCISRGSQETEWTGGPAMRRAGRNLQQQRAQRAGREALTQFSVLEI